MTVRRVFPVMHAGEHAYAVASKIEPRIGLQALTGWNVSGLVPPNCIEVGLDVRDDDWAFMGMVVLRENEDEGGTICDTPHKGHRLAPVRFRIKVALFRS